MGDVKTKGNMLVIGPILWMSGKQAPDMARQWKDKTGVQFF